MGAILICLLGAAASGSVITSGQYIPGAVGFIGFGMFAIALLAKAEKKEETA